MGGSSLGFLCGWYDSEFRQKIMSMKFIEVFAVYAVIFSYFQLFSVVVSKKTDECFPKSIYGASGGLSCHWCGGTLVSVFIAPEVGPTTE